MSSGKELPYVLTESAAADLRVIARNTLTRWSEKQASIYFDKLDVCLEKIGNRQTITRKFSQRFPNLECVKCNITTCFIFEKVDINQ